jgi:hypothetical protein
MTTIWSKSASISWIFLKLNEMKWIVHDFWLSFAISNEQIEPNLNGVFANKYDKIRCWPRNFWEILRNFEKFWEILRNFEKFWEISNSLISLLRLFVYNRSIRKNYLLSGFSFTYFESHQSYLQFFSGFKVFGL